MTLPTGYDVLNAYKDTKEIPGSKHNSDIIMMHSFTTYKATTDEVPWCKSAHTFAEFVATYARNPGFVVQEMTKRGYSKERIKYLTSTAQKVLTEKFGLSVNDIYVDNPTTKVELPNFSAAARMGLLYGVAVKTPRLGDWVVYERGSDGVSGHIHYWVKTTLTSYGGLGGNQNNKVGVDFYSKYKCLGIRRPLYLV